MIHGKFSGSSTTACNLSLESNIISPWTNEITCSTCLNHKDTKKCLICGNTSIDTYCPACKTALHASINY